jgi:hypothetical protein
MPINLLLLQYPPIPWTQIDLKGLSNLSLWFGKLEFLKKFGFHWKQDLKGKDIPGYQSKMVPRVFDVWFDFPTTKPDRQSIEDCVSTRAFR